MSQQITMAFVQQYRANVTLLIQQQQSKLEPLVRVETQSSQFEFFESIGPVSAQPWGPRHGDTPLMETPHMRRRVGIFPWVWADLIDDPDRVRTLIEPTSPYVSNAVMAFNRRKDDIILQAALAPAMVGHDGNEPLYLPATNNHDLTAETGPAGTGRMTIKGLMDLKEALWNDDIDGTNGVDDSLVIVCSPNQIRSLLEDPKVQNSDYNTIKALVQGDIDSYMGFRFVRSTRLPREQVTTPEGVRYKTKAIAWAPGGVLMTKGQDIVVEIERRADKKYSTQIFVSMDIGGTRMDEKLVRTLTTYDATRPFPAP